jgi:hypothetical protein
MVTGLWLVVLGALVASVVGAALVLVAPGVLAVELQALTMTMAAVTVASAFNLP